MDEHQYGDVTSLLRQWTSGDPSALDKLVPIVYDELRKLAVIRSRAEAPDATLPPTALVHEVFLKLAGQYRVHFHNRAQFFGAAARILRRILVDRARERHALKRGGSLAPSPLDDVAAAFACELPADAELIDLHHALNALEQFDPQKAKVVDLRYFAGFSITETAELLELSETTVKREWSVARAWLYERLHGVTPADSAIP